MTIGITDYKNSTVLLRQRQFDINNTTMIVLQ